MRFWAIPKSGSNLTATEQPLMEVAAHGQPGAGTGAGGPHRSE